MSNPLLLLMRLEGPLQSWGTRSRWDVRDSDEQPTKSGIVGLLGCAMGIPVGHRRLPEMDASLRLGVRTDSAGKPMVDYHTITGIIPTASGGHKGSDEDPATVISPRTYLQDAAFLAVLAGPAELLQQCACALSQPRWPLYLGRKCCLPTRPVLEELADRYPTTEAALTQHPWSCLWIESRHNKARLVPAVLDCTLEDPAGNEERWDAVQTNPARMYGLRHVRTFTVKPVLEAQQCPVI